MCIKAKYTCMCLYILFSQVVCLVLPNLAREFPVIFLCLALMVTALRVIEGPWKSQKESSENRCSPNSLPNLVPGRRGCNLFTRRAGVAVPIQWQFFLLLQDLKKYAESVFWITSSLPRPIPLSFGGRFLFFVFKGNSVGWILLPGHKGEPLQISVPVVPWAGSWVRDCHCTI